MFFGKKPAAIPAAGKPGAKTKWQSKDEVI
jgi:hypothetical protein